MQSNKPILIVDDNFDNLSVLGNFLSSNGFEVQFASNGIAALDVISFQAPDLILLDVEMPGMNGYELAKRIKSNVLTSEIPILFISTWDEKDKILKGFESGGVDYISKPVDFEMLLARVNAHLKIVEQKKVLQELNVQLEKKNQEISESLIYAGIIQNALFPERIVFHQCFLDHFIYQNPKSIIGGDFYLLENFSDCYILALGDCTGHGVPGAFLSVLGITLLRQILSEEIKFIPEKILFNLEQEFSKIIYRQDNTEKLFDGIDISVLVIDKVSKTITFSGARRPLVQAGNGNLRSYAGSIHGIGGVKGIYPKEFKNVQIDYQEGDWIYLFTDGITDLYHKTQNRKLGSRQWQQHLIDYSAYNGKEQYDKIHMLVADYAGGFPIADDITVIGFHY